MLVCITAPKKHFAFVEIRRFLCPKSRDFRRTGGPSRFTFCCGAFPNRFRSRQNLVEGRRSVCHGYCALHLPRGPQKNSGPFVWNAIRIGFWFVVFGLPEKWINSLKRIAFEIRVGYLLWTWVRCALGFRLVSLKKFRGISDDSRYPGWIVPQTRVFLFAVEVGAAKCIENTVFRLFENTRRQTRRTNPAVGYGSTVGR